MLFRSYHKEKALVYGGYKNITVRNKQLVFERAYEKEAIYIAMNLEECIVNVSLSGISGTFINLFTGEEIVLSNDVILAPYEFALYKKVN